MLVTYNKLKKEIGLLYNFYNISLEAAIIRMGDVLMDVGITISVIYLIVGIADFIFEYVKFKMI